MAFGHSSPPGAPSSLATERRTGIPTGFTLHNSCHPGHEDTASFSTNQGKWPTYVANSDAFPILQLLLIYYRKSTVVQGPVDG